MKHVALLGALTCALVTIACGSDAPSPNPGGPSPVTTTSVTTTSIPTVVSLTGFVSNALAGGAGIRGAVVTITDGPNAGQTTSTDGAGSYAFSTVTPGNANLAARAAGFDDQGRGVFIDGRNTLNFSLRPLLFTRSGRDDQVFDMPTWISRIRIIGDYPGRCQNFIVHIGGRGVVNEILGPCFGLGSHWEGTYVTSGGVTEIMKSTGVAWSFTEVR